MIIEEKKIPYEGKKGICIVAEPGNSIKRNTGTWRLMKPVIDHSRCISCKTCFTVCPDSAIKWSNEKPNSKSKLNGRPDVDFTMCKGCAICSVECPVKCIKMERDLHEQK